MASNMKGADWKLMVLFGLEKLLGGSMYFSEDSLTFQKQCLALVACRLPLQFVKCSGIAPQLVAEQMAWCIAVSWHRESVYLGYINEPLLAAAAFVNWAESLEQILQCLVAGCGTYLSSKWELGETSACVLLLDAIDRAYDESKAKKIECEPDGIATTQESRQGSPAKKLYRHAINALPKCLALHGVVSVEDFLESAFSLTVEVDDSMGTWHKIPLDARSIRSSPVAGFAWQPNVVSAGMAKRSRVYVPERIAKAHVRFKSIKKATGIIGCRDIPFLFEANVAVFTRDNQKVVDLLIPLRLCNDQKNTEWSCLVIQVKNRRNGQRAGMVARQKLHPKLTEAVQCNARCPGECGRCSFMSENHFGVVLNFHAGKVSAFEQKRCNRNKRRDALKSQVHKLENTKGRMAVDPGVPVW